MTTFSLALLCGITAVQHFSELPGVFTLCGLAVIAVFLYRKRQRPWFFLILGILWACIFAEWRMAERLPNDTQTATLDVSGYVASLPQRHDGRVSFDFAVSEPAGDFPQKIHLNWYHPRQPVLAGQNWRLNVKIKPPYGRLNPDGFDYEAWLFANRIGAVGYVRSKPAPSEMQPSRNPARYFACWRQAISDRLDAALPAGKQLAVIKALTIGNQSDISQTEWDVFRTTGTTHLIVISGSHISLIAGLVYFLVRRSWARLGILAVSPQQVAALAAWLAALFYAGLAGYSVPTLRAVVMLTVTLAAIACQRNVSPWQILLLALDAVLLFDPLAVLSAGFWLSFAAVGLLLYVSTGRLGRNGYWREAVTTQLATAIGLSPLLMVFFQQVSLVAPLANWVAVPVIGLAATPLALAAILLLPVSASAATFCLQLTDLVLQGLWQFLSKMADLPGATFYCQTPPWYALPAAVAGILLLMAPRGFPARYLSPLLFLPMVFPGSSNPLPGTARLTLLDVGQGLSAVLQTAEHTLVFDTGGKIGEFSDMGDTVLAPFLRRQGIRNVDTLVVSHGDNDHSGGADSLLAELPVERILSSAPQWAEHSGGGYCRAGQKWQWDQVRFSLLSPPDPEDAFAKENDNSCVLKVEAGEQSILLTGDIEGAAESWLTEHYAGELKSSVLIAPHHGSKTSSSYGFLRQVRPRLVAIPAGHLNRFGFPHRQVLARYADLELPWLNTATEGAITVLIGNGIFRVETAARHAKRYWMKRTLPKAPLAQTAE